VYGWEAEFPAVTGWAAALAMVKRSFVFEGK
jgi:hypothetical protein